MIKVLIADDSAFMRKILSEIISSDPKFTIVGIARDGIEAIEKVEKLNPDVMTLDLEMPLMDGLEVIEKLMKTNPLPILVVTGTSESKKPFEALKLGALDFILKPSGSISLDMEKVKDELLKKLNTLSSVKNDINKLSNKLDIKNSFFDTHISNNKINTFHFSPSNKKILLIAASTGGPQTIERLLTLLPKNIPVPILIVQHMPEHFTKTFSERLSLKTGFNVKEAKSGDLLKNGEVLLAPGNYHMEVSADLTHQNGFIILNQDSPELGVRPNANRLFISASQLYKDRTIGIVLTGMGFDGTEGCRQIKSYHGVVIAQSESSSIIYGMPKSVVDSKLADLILSIEDMPKIISQLIDT